MNVIKFYTTKGEHGYMSNFYRSAVIIDGKEYMTTEHYYQANKFEPFATTEPMRFGGPGQETIHEFIRKQPTPMAAATAGRKKDWPYPLRAGWDKGISDFYMRRALCAKFTQHPDLAEKLLATGDAYLVEDTTTTNDLYWGCGTSGDGLNQLGLMLMEIRGKLRNGFLLPC